MSKAQTIKLQTNCGFSGFKTMGNITKQPRGILANKCILLLPTTQIRQGPTDREAQLSTKETSRRIAKLCCYDFFRGTSRRIYP